MLEFQVYSFEALFFSSEHGTEVARYCCISRSENRWNQPIGSLTQLHLDNFLHWALLSSDQAVVCAAVESNPLASRPRFHFWSCDCCINLGVLIVEVTPRRCVTLHHLQNKTRQGLDSESAAAHRESDADTISRSTKCSLSDLGGGVICVFFYRMTCKTF